MFEDVPESYDPEKENSEYHFFYNREERIKNAPQIVQDYYAGKMKPLRGIQLFTKNKSNRFILIALIFFVGVAWIYSGFNQSRNYAKINEIDCELSAFSYEDEVYVALKVKRNVKSKKTAPEKISVVFMPVDVDRQVVAETEVSVIYEKGEAVLRSKYTDYDIIRIDAAVTVGNSTGEVSAAVKR